MNAIETNNLSKFFGSTKAVEDLSLHVRYGEIYGFLGLNGAGKTTTIRMLLGMIKPTEGEAFILGQKIDRTHGPWESVGYMVETPGAYPNLTVRENLELICRLRNSNNNAAISDCLNRLKLTKYEDVRAQYLSLGNFQRLGLAKALIHRPKVLLLDEPSNGLDPEGIVEIRELLLDLAQNHHVTILLSSHILEEISKIASRIGVIHEGKLLQEINANELNQHCFKKLVLHTRDDEAAAKVIKAKGIDFSKNGHISIIDPQIIENPDKLVVMLVNENVAPVMIKVEEENLEDYFLRIIK